MENRDGDLGSEIVGLVYDKYHSLKQSGKPQDHEWTVLSSIVEERNGSKRVIVLTTGTKCIGATSLSPQGFIVNDCHAEILSRRGFILYLMEQLKLCKENPEDDTIFTCKSDSNKYCLKEGIRYHMYISQSPCGYASEYFEEDAKRKALEISNAKVRLSKRRCLEQHIAEESTHRTGAKFETGNSIYLSTKPGRGDPSRSYSCSDKLCMYNHLGYQGGLLTNLIEPIFMSSITISGPWDEKRMREALFDRISSDQVSFKGSVPVLYHSTNPSPFSAEEVMKHLNGKKLAASGSSLIWIVPNHQEVLISGKGVRLGTNVKKEIQKKNTSMVCPSSLLSRYLSLISCDSDSCSMWSLKQNAVAYQKLKCHLFSGWKRKDRSLLSFCNCFLYKDQNRLSPSTHSLIG